MRSAASQLIVFGVAANPDPDHNTRFHVTECTVMVADTRADQVIAALQSPVSERRMMRVCLPEAVALLGEALNVRGKVLE
jgi:hypothetical protein